MDRQAGVEHHDGVTTSGLGDPGVVQARGRRALLRSRPTAIDPILDRLERGARVADIDCDNGYGTVVLAEAFPRSFFYGFDPHPVAVGQARENAVMTDCQRRLRYQVADATSYPAEHFDLICLYRVLVGSADPAGVVAHAREALAEGGHVLLFESCPDDASVEARCIEWLTDAGFETHERVADTEAGPVFLAGLGHAPNRLTRAAS